MHGAPDWGMYAPKETVFALQDMAELAARLGSIVTFDRRGNVIWMDDFEAGIGKWNRASTGTGGEVILSAETARSGGLSAKLTTGNLLNNIASLSRYLPYTVLSKIAVELSFALLTDENLFTLYFHLGDGAKAHRVYIRYNQVTGILELMDAAPSYQTIASDLYLYASKYNFNTIKVVVDFLNDKYTRIILNDKVYDVSAHSLSPYDYIYNPHLYIDTTVYALVGINQTVFVDDVIITQNEP